MIDDGVLNFMGVMLSLVLAGGAAYGMIIVLNALQRRLGGGTSDSHGELAELRERLERLEVDHDDPRFEDMALRVAELEERLEFAERLLSSEENRARLPEPSDEVTSPSQKGAAHG